MRLVSRLRGNRPLTRPAAGGHTYAKYYWTGSAWETDYMHGNPLDSSQLVMRSDNNYLEAEVFYPFGTVRWSGGGTQDVRYAEMQDSLLNFKSG